jgi:tripartite-type tricarboxylate transporter receptor subunit TctC
MTTSIHRRHVLASLAAMGAGAFGPLQALAQEAYPGKGPIKLIVPLPAGGAADATVRVLGAALQTQMKQSFVIDNKPGGSFVIGMQAIAQAPADGYTLMHVNPGMCAAQAALKKIDLLKTLTPISAMGTMPALLVVPASSPIKSVKELIAAGTAKPGSLNYGSVGIGSLEHLWCSNFSKRNRLDAVHVPFKGMPDAATALASGEVQFLSLVQILALSFIQKGMMRALAVIDNQRIAALPNVPTLKELGYDEPPLVFWGGLAAPKGTPPAIIEMLRENIAAAVANPEVKTKLAGMGTTAMSSPTSAAFEAQITQELAWLTDAVKAANLQLN